MGSIIPWCVACSLSQQVSSELSPANTAELRRQPILRAEHTAETSSVEHTAALANNLQAVPYSLIVHSYSNLSLTATIEQNSFEPGAMAQLYANVTESGIPIALDSHVWADLTNSSGTTGVIKLTRDTDDRYVGVFKMATSGVYRFRIRANGQNSRGEHFYPGENAYGCRVAGR